MALGGTPWPVMEVRRALMHSSRRQPLAGRPGLGRGSGDLADEAAFIVGVERMARAQFLREHGRELPEARVVRRLLPPTP